jgi:hypothetical protein
VIRLRNDVLPEYHKEALGRTEPDFEAWIYEGGTHNPLSLANSIPRTIAFLEALGS